MRVGALSLLPLARLQPERPPLSCPPASHPAPLPQRRPRPPGRPHRMPLPRRPHRRMPLPLPRRLRPWGRARRRLPRRLPPPPQKLNVWFAARTLSPQGLEKCGCNVVAARNGHMNSAQIQEKLTLVTIVGSTREMQGLSLGSYIAPTVLKSWVKSFSS